MNKDKRRSNSNCKILSNENSKINDKLFENTFIRKEIIANGNKDRIIVSSKSSNDLHSQKNRNSCENKINLHFSYKKIKFYRFK